MPDPVNTASDAAKAVVDTASKGVVDTKNAARADVAASPMKSVLIAAAIGAVLVGIAIVAFKAFHG